MINKKIYLVFEIILLIGSLFAFAYLISDTTIQSVDAEETGCCIDSCNSVSDGCEDYREYSSCDAISECELGCCMNKDRGIGSSKLSKDCEGSQEDFTSFEDSEYSSCIEIFEDSAGCCKYNLQGQDKEIWLMNSDVCVSYYEGKTNGKTSTECGQGGLDNNERGACVRGVNCKMMNGVENCEADENNPGTFYEGSLCSDPDISTECTKQDHTAVYNNKIYWYDSCGQPENVYFSDKDKSWNNGKVIDDDEICTSIENYCGNCGGEQVAQRYDSKSPAYEKWADTDYVCGSGECKGTINGKEIVLENGEATCVYDGNWGYGNEGTIMGADKSSIGYSPRPVGAESYQVTCQNGELTIKSCSENGANSICVSDGTNGQPSCVENNWQKCLTEYTDGSEGFQKCSEDPFCYVKEINFGDYFHIVKCLPKYPPIKSDSSGSSSEYCNQATKTCDASLNPNCKDSDEFIKQMNEFCISLGDCGAYVNLAGSYTAEGAKLNGVVLSDESLNTDNLGNRIVQYIKNSEFVEQIIKANTKDPIQEGTLMEITAKTDSEEDSSFDWLGGINTVLGFVGSIVGMLIAGPIGMFIGIGITIISWLLGEVDWDSEDTPVNMEFSCLPWQAPTNADNCELCNQGDLPCSEYKCTSLGACNFLAEGEVCIPIEDDGKSPVITFHKESLPSYFKVEESDGKVKLSSQNKETNYAIPSQTLFTLNVSTDEPADCYYSYEGSSAQQDFGDSTNYDYEHITEYGMLTEKEFEDYVGKDKWAEVVNNGGLEKIYGNIKLNVVCKDNYGNPGTYEIDMSFNKEDTVQPYVTYPETASTWLYNEDSLDLELQLNEGVTCRWDFESTEYDLMNLENEGECCKSVKGCKINEKNVNWGYCLMHINGLDSSLEDNQLYINCKDQPGLIRTDKESTRKEMKEPWGYKVNFVNKPLVINLAEARDSLTNTKKEIFTAKTRNKFNIKLYVETAGGSKNEGNAECSIKIGDGKFAKMDKTSSAKSVNYLTFTPQISGDKTSQEITAQVFCNDSRNLKISTDIKTFSFTIEQDVNPPIWVRLNQILSGTNPTQIKLEANEQLSACMYSYESGKDWVWWANEDQKSLRSGSFGITKEVVTIPIKTGQKNYYIKCNDTFGNMQTEQLFSIVN